MSEVKIKSNNLNVFYGDKQALFDVNLDLNEKEVTALINYISEETLITSFFVLQIVTPFPAAKPSALTTIGVLLFLINFFTSEIFLQILKYLNDHQLHCHQALMILKLDVN